MSEPEEKLDSRENFNISVSYKSNSNKDKDDKIATYHIKGRNTYHTDGSKNNSWGYYGCELIDNTGNRRLDKKVNIKWVELEELFVRRNEVFTDDEFHSITGKHLVTSATSAPVLHSAPAPVSKKKAAQEEAAQEEAAQADAGKGFKCSVM